MIRHCFSKIYFILCFYMSFGVLLMFMQYWKVWHTLEIVKKMTVRCFGNVVRAKETLVYNIVEGKRSQERQVSGCST